MAIKAASLLLCSRLHMVTKTGNITLGDLFTRIKASGFPTEEQTVVVYALLVGAPGEKGLVTIECRESESGDRLLFAEDSVEMGMEGKRSVSVSFQGFRFPQAGNYEFSLACNGEVIGAQTLPVDLSKVS